MFAGKSAAGIGGDVRVVATGSLSGTLSAVLSTIAVCSGLTPRNAGSSGVVGLTVVGSSW